MTLYPPATHLRRRLRRITGFHRDESGVAAMEFAIIAPIIIGVYLGLAELAMVLGVERQVSHSASVAGDLATQAAVLEEADIEDILSATLRVANVSDTNDYVLHMESFDRDSSGSEVSLGEIVYGAGRESWLEDFDAADLSADMLAEGSGIVVARVAYRYTPMGMPNTLDTDSKKGLLPTSLTLTETFLLKPRRSATVEVGAGTGTKFTCTGSASGMNCSS
ncbi:TadE/TadG family type IV pilus assembly protein [Algimonas porphyrae]|uniref:Pilus biosynthesis protein TadE n=1 Tax=Algimonas porphyrae TaxID=1128113 RepID=A0ABQ5UYV2_9PROT|nr:TadE/TadG family type IV pilus assembly protein [Algimonas porphyrae]GLQ19945.1 pilus biosynthesis protein TadE [Algimonas porphyrae]